jgi:hypothetical protein
VIYEFAVSPGLFDREERVTFLYEAFGMEAGRFISDFPQKQWSHLARAIIKKSAPGYLDHQKWITALIALEQRAMYRRQGAVWKDDLNWINNAVEEHRRRPFKGILHDERCSEPAAIRFGIDMGRNQDWKCSASRHVPRVADQMVRAVAPLIELSKSLVLVDPYFWAVDGRWKNVLLSFARYVADSSMRPKINHIHYITSIEEKIPDEETERQCRQFLEPDLPAGVSVGFYLVLPALLHDRFVLTDSGGVQFGRGLDEGMGDVLITRLGDETYQKEWDKASMFRSEEAPGMRRKFILGRQ